CSTLHPDPPAQPKLEGPPSITSRGLKYFDVDDGATEWYLNTRRSTAERKPCKRKFCFRFRVPIRHALRRKNKAATFSLPGRRVSPEFLCLLKQHHARMRGLEQLRRKYLPLRPSFDYYKYDAEAKSRHMRPGIDTAAPLEFPCTNVACIRHHEKPLCPCPRNMDVSDPLTTENIQASKSKPKTQGLKMFAKNKGTPDQKKSNQKVLGKENVQEAGKAYSKDINKLKESKLKGTSLHRIYVSNPSLAPPLKSKKAPNLTASKSQHTFELSRTSKPRSRSQGNLRPIEKIINCPCPFDTPKWLPKSLNSSICPNKKARFRKSRDPRCIEYKNRPFFKALQGTNYANSASKGNRKARSCSQIITSRDNGICSITSKEECWTSNPDQGHCKVHENVLMKPVPTAEHSFHASISSNCKISVERTYQPAPDQNDIEMPPNRQGVSTGYKGFVHLSEKQKIHDQFGCPIPKCKKKKPPPYCYLWSAVDPDIRNEEKKRLAEHNSCQRQMFPDSRPYSYYWSKTNPDIRSRVKEKLRSTDSEKNCHLPQLQFKRSYSDTNPESCRCSSSIITQFSSDFDELDNSSSTWKSKSSQLWNPRNRKETSNGSSVMWEDDDTPTKENQKKGKRKWSGPVLRKLSTDSDRHIPKKPRLLPRLHAFAKRFFWTGSKVFHFKSNQSESERPTHSSRSRDSLGGGYRKREGSLKLEPLNDTQSEMCKETNSSVNKRITFRDHAKIQDIRGPRDLKLWTKQSHRSNNLESSSRRLDKSPNSSGSEIVRYRKWADFRTTSQEPSCSTGPPKMRNRHRSQPKETTRRDRSGSYGSCSWNSKSSGSCKPKQQYSCQARQPLVPRAQREWEERRERRKARRQKAQCGPCTDYFITSRTLEPRYPDIRQGIVTYRNYEFSTKLSDHCLVQPKLTEHSPKHRAKNG
uniref:Uncharacterized protein LOC108043717 n=1 Tax=Drosophila rhopaloa TaxID=1041015 RepID=A0A6P4EY74_DRORH